MKLPMQIRHTFVIFFNSINEVIDKLWIEMRISLEMASFKMK